MFWNKKIEDDKGDLEADLDKLRVDVREAKDELATTKHKHKLELEDIEHLTRITKEKLEVEGERKLMTKESEYQVQLGQVRDEYRVKMETQLKSEADGIRDMYKEILTRLPNINVKMKGDV